MFKKDFIIRQFEEFGKVLGKILGFKLDRDWEKFESELADAVSAFSKLELSEIDKMNLEEFTAALIKSEKLSSDQTKMLARLMFERLESFILRGETQLIQLQKEKCLALYEKAARDLTQNEFDLDIHFKLEFLRKL